jgi:hypothetical protein
MMRTAAVLVVSDGDRKTSTRSVTIAVTAAGPVLASRFIADRRAACHHIQPDPHLPSIRFGESAL